MPDVLIRNLAAEDLDLLDEQARRVGLSRNEFLRRHLQQQARRASTSVTVADLEGVADLVSDLADDGVMRDAWS